MYIQAEDITNLSVLGGVMIPFAGTALGSACVFFMKKDFGMRVGGFTDEFIKTRLNKTITERGDGDWQ